MRDISGKINNYLLKPVHIAPLVVFRILFGGVMLASIIRFYLKGWIYELYIKPDFYFSYYGFEWVQPLGSTGMYLLYALMGIATVGIILGYFYRFSALLFFLAFTYGELIDKTNYLNHYYFISIVAFLLILVPAHRYFSLDVLRKPHLKVTHIPFWVIGVFQLQLGIVYCYAGMAKLNYDWLVRAMPLKIWLPANAGLPVIGWLFDYTWTAYAFSWFGAVFDLSIPFLLACKKSRPFAYILVISFHMMTAMLFQIGMFPYIMILLTLIFFPESFHQKIISGLTSLGKNFLPKPFPGTSGHNLQTLQFYPKWGHLLKGALIVHILLQLILPWRYLLYPGHLFWNEQGYRFSWRVMLMEKVGYTIFHVRDPATGHSREVEPGEYLTPNQEKMMATQPDMLLQFAHFLEKKFKYQGINDPKITAESYVTLNGRGSRLFINDTVDLTKIKQGFHHKDWIIPLEKNDEVITKINER